MNIGVGGVNLGGINSGEDSSKVTQPAAKQTRNDPYASISNQSTWRAGMLHAKPNLDSNQAVEVAAIDMTSLDPARLKSFQEKIENAIVRQEGDMLRAVNTFAGNEPTLRKAVSSMLLAS